MQNCLKERVIIETDPFQIQTSSKYVTESEKVFRNEMMFYWWKKKLLKANGFKVSSATTIGTSIFLHVS